MASTATFKIVDYKNAAAHIGKQLEARIIAGVQSTAIRLRTAAIERTQAENPTPVDRGMFIAAWYVNFNPRGATVGNNAPHAPFIEFGVNPANVKIGRAMIDALAEWALRKGLVARTTQRRASGKEEGGPSREQQARELAWAIAQNMKKRGIFNRQLFYSAADSGLRILEKTLKTNLQQFAREEIARELRMP